MNKPPDRPLLFAMLVNIYFPDDPTWQIITDEYGANYGKIYKVYEYRRGAQIVNLEDGRIRDVNVVGVVDMNGNWGYMPEDAFIFTVPDMPIQPTERNLKCH